ncbi:hypothetical protein IFU01_02000 [Oxalobacteraceae sp. CFBP 8763]|nr:hypothetical protein [Oxalobacteraceae sp. CFBP 8763]
MHSTYSTASKLPDASTIDGVTTDWDFTPSPIMRWERRQMAERFARAVHRRPASHVVVPASAQKAWVVYFLFAPDGVLHAAHRFTLARLREEGLPILVVCSCADKSRMPADLPALCDALLWKATPGYDFSAYTLALRHLSRRSPGADVIVMNDSVFGPFTPLRPVLDSGRWDLTGFTASSELTNHVQSYAFCLRDVTPARMARLATVFFPFGALSAPQDVIALQETRMARVAARSMTVGALWFGDATRVHNPTLVKPMELLDAGFPFLKRALLTKSSNYIERDVVLERLARLGHPLDV